MSQQINGIILNFLQNPHVTAHVNAFARWCVAEFQVHLRRRERGGYRNPRDLTDPARSLENLAIDLSGLFLANDSGRDFGMVFNYLKRKGITEYHDSNVNEIKNRLRAQMCRFTAQRVHTIAGETDPQAAKLKRRIEDALNRLADAHEINGRKLDDNRSLVFPGSASIETDAGTVPVSYEEMVEIAESAFHNSGSEQELCLLLFKELDERCGNEWRIYEHDLIGAIVTVLVRLEYSDSIFPSALPRQTQLILNAEFTKEAKYVLEHTVKPLLQKYVEKGSLKKEDLPLLLEAVTCLFDDLCSCADSDLLPRYFYEQMPTETHDRYVQDYKNVFDSVIKKALEAFEDRCKNNPTIRKLWGY